MAGGVLQQAAPATADVEQRHARFQLQLAADQIELGELGLVERLRVFPVAAAVGHGIVEHQLEQVVAQVVVLLRHLAGAAQALPVTQGVGEYLKRQHPAVLAQVVAAGAQHAERELIQGVAVPPAVHVGLAEPQGALRGDAGKGFGMVDPHVPGTAAVDLDVRVREHPVDQGVDGGRTAGRGALRSMVPAVSTS